MNIIQDIVLASDHRGYELKQKIKEYLRERKYFFIDVGVENDARPSDTDEVPPIIRVAREACECVTGSNNFAAILICANGLGMSIMANRYKGIRAALCNSPDIARDARAHNDCNVLCLAGDNADFENIKKILNAFLTTKPESEARYIKRRQLFDQI